MRNAVRRSHTRNINPVRRATPRRRLLALSALLLLAAGCGRSVESTRVVGASLFPLASLTEAVAGESWNVVTLLPPGRSPHDFEPTAAGLRDLGGTPLVVMVGTSADAWMERAVRAVGDPHLRIASLSQVAAPDADPHLWLDLDVVERFLPLLADQFAELDPEGAEGYRDRATAALDSLAAFDAAAAARLAPVRDAPFVLLHPAMEAFVTRYDLDLVAVLQTQPEGEAHPRKLGDVARELQERGGHVIFAEPQLSGKLATSIALETGGDVHFLDPLGGPGVPGRGTYFDLLRWNTQQLEEALGDSS